MAVPRSGCFTIKATGTKSNRPATKKSSGRNWPSRFWNHHANIKGMAIFMISLGWMTKPILSQRLAPFLVKPNKATAINKATPTVYKGTANAIKRCGGICATTNMMKPANTILRPWSINLAPLAKPDEYMVNIPAHTSKKMPNANGPSKPFKSGLIRRYKLGL